MYMYNSNADYYSNLMNTFGLEKILIASSTSDIFVSKCTFFCCICKVSRQRGSACNSAISKDRSARKGSINVHYISRKLLQIVGSV
jgi:uncharacterized Fe-S radical SAM superfamily protein PflX